MDDKEKLKFLQKMGFSISRLSDSNEDIKTKNKKQINTQVDLPDKKDLLFVGKIFDVTPQKSQSLTDFLKEEKD